MKQLWVSLVLGVLAGCGGGGIRSYEDAMNANSRIMGEMVDVLEGVNDEASAEKAAAEIEKLGGQLLELAKKTSDLPQPSVEEMERIAREQVAKQQEFQTRAAAQMMKLAEYESLGAAWQRALTNSGAGRR